MFELSIVIMLVACVIAFLMNNRNKDEKILASIYILSGLAVMLIPMFWGWQIFWIFVFCGIVIGAMNNGSLNPTKLPSKAIGIMMFFLVPIKIVFIDWIGWEGAGWPIFFHVLYWCYEYIMACRKN